MKKILYLLFISSSCFAQLAVEVKSFNPEELKQDLTILFEKLEAIHPSLYHYTSKSNVDEVRAAVEKELNRSMTRIEFARKAIPLISMLKDGHTSLVFPRDEWLTFLKKGGKIFPFDVLIRENKIFITANYSADSTLSTFTEILAINEKPTPDLLKELRPYISAELDFYRDTRLQKAFKSMLWSAYGWGGNFDVELIIKGEMISKKIHGITEQGLTEAIKKSGKQRSAKPYSYYTLENNVAVIDFRSMNDLDKFNNFLDSTFAIIRKDNIQHLVVDIRNNSGGNSQLGDALFNYITDKPYKQIERIEVKNSVEAGRVRNKNSKKKRHA